MSGRDANQPTPKWDEQEFARNKKAVEKALAPPERDANQLAADVRAALGPCTHSYCGIPEEPTCARHEAQAALDELVALVGTLQDDAERERDCFDMDANGPCGDCLTCRAARADALEAQVGTLQQERDDARLLVQGGNCIRDESGKSPCEAAEAALAEMTEAAQFAGVPAWTRLWNEKEDAVAALATTRQALTPFVEFLNPDALMQGAEWPARFRDYQDAARRVLADTGGDTKPGFRCVIGYPGPLPCNGCPEHCPEHAGGDTKGGTDA